MWYGEVAERAARLHQKDAQNKVSEKHNVVIPVPKHLLPVSRPGSMYTISENIYRSLFFLMVFMLTFAFQLVPLMGRFVHGHARHPPPLVIFPNASHA